MLTDWGILANFDTLFVLIPLALIDEIVRSLQSISKSLRQKGQKFIKVPEKIFIHYTIGMH